MKTLHNINPADLIDMSAQESTHSYRVEIAYARDDNLLFGQQIYRSDAHLWLHQDLADIVSKAAQDLNDQGYCLILYDGLRTVDAQAAMLETCAVKENPHWLEEPRLLSPPGAGAHPRGMAIDCSIKTLEGRLLDMGTPFDYLSTDPAPESNPAHRAYTGLTEEIRQNRKILDTAMIKAAQDAGTPIWPLPQEWWDFRLPLEVSETYAPLSDADLPPEMRMVRYSQLSSFQQSTKLAKPCT